MATAVSIPPTSCGVTITPKPPPPKPKPGLVTTEAYLDPAEIQNLAEQIGALSKAAPGQALKYKLTIEFGGDKRPTDEQIKKLNLRLKGESVKQKI